VQQARLKSAARSLYIESYAQLKLTPAAEGASVVSR